MDSSIFYSHCLIRGKEYEFCIDHNEKATLVSIAVVKELGLPSSWHPHPYYIYFNGRPVYVTLQAWVSIDLNGYKSDMLCDVFPMSGESIVFGRAWLREYEVMYDLSRTQYSFYGMGKKYVLDSSHVLAKQKKELERVEQWKKLEAKWKADAELFFQKHGITREEVLYGKKPKVPPVVIPVADNVVVATEDEIVVPAEVSPNEVEVSTQEVVIDFDDTDDIAKATMHEEVVDSEVFPKVEALVDIPEAHDTKIFDTINATPIMLMADLDIVEGGDILKHTFADPYLARVDVSPDLHLYDYLASDQGFIHTYIQPRVCFGILLVAHGATTPHAIDLKVFVRYIFDPGVPLEFFLGSHDVVHDGAQFYDILLIRGRILSNREGMM